MLSHSLILRLLCVTTIVAAATSAPSANAAAVKPPYFQTADWLWNPIPANPVVDPSSAKIGSELGAGTHSAGLYDYGVDLPAPSMCGSSVGFDVAFSEAWGADPFHSDLAPIPGNAVGPPGSDGQISVADPCANKVFSLWQARRSGKSWSASWGAEVSLSGNGLETGQGSSTGSQISRYAGVIRGSEIAAGSIKHAMFISSKFAAAMFRYPAQKTDGSDTANTPIPEGTRVQLDPTINVAAIPGITPGELTVAKALQTYGAYIGDNGAAAVGLLFEFVNDGTDPGRVYTDAGLSWDYYAMPHIPWHSLRALKTWNGK